MSVLGAAFGTGVSIPIVYFLREHGIAPSLVLAAATTIATSWWYSRKVRIPSCSITLAQVIRDSAPLLKLGFAFMASVLLTTGSAYAVRIVILRTLGFSATGLYQSAWTLGGLYVTFILQAMGTDFYPRLTLVAADNALCNRMVNEQARIGLLVATPGVIATLTFAPTVIATLYSPEFHAAVDVLRWICLGVTLRVLTWPMGFIIMAKGRHNLFLLSDFSWTLVYLGLTSLCLRYFALPGAGFAFFGSYIFHGCLSYSLVRTVSGFRWSHDNKRAAFFLLSVVAIVFTAFQALSVLWAVCIGMLGLAVSCAYSIHEVLVLVLPGKVLMPLRQDIFQIGSAACRLRRLLGRSQRRV
jgi:PST family polysaccharide transporter